MRIAFASSDGINVDSHFAQAESFHLWEIGPRSAEALGAVRLGADSDEREERVRARADALDGCTLVYLVQIGGPAAAKLAARHVQPVKVRTGTGIVDAIVELQNVLTGNPPPWLRKAQMNAESRLGGVSRMIG